MTKPSPMTPSRPYLLRALYEWITDNQFTPHLLVDAAAPGVEVPKSSVQDGRVVLNVDPAAVQSLKLGNEWIHFSARFSGVAREVAFPVSAVLAIYARENGQGMMFSTEPGGPPQPPDAEPPDGGPGGRGRPGLRVVK